jgi:ABC-type polar amino acid transport system ATPase subunit
MCHFFENNDIVQNAELIKHRTNLYHVFYRWNQRQHKSIEKNCGEPLWDTKREESLQLRANLDKILNKYLNKNKINYKNHTM